MKMLSPALPAMLVVGCLAAPAAFAGPEPAAAGTPVLTMDGNAISWTSVPGATGYDVVRGDLGILRQTGGDFTAATRSCLADDSPATQIDYLGIPKPGQVFWFLVRAGTATQPGTYDSGGAGQAGSRDAGIEAAAPACFSPFVPHAVISINGDSGFVAANGVTGGDGTPADPYVISGWDVACQDPDAAGIQVANTTASFTVRNVFVHGCHYGVLLVSARNGRVERSRFTGIVHGVRVFSGGDTVVRGNTVTMQQGSGVDVLGATSVLVAENTVDRGFLGINFDGASQCSAHHNNLLGNAGQAQDIRGGANTWDDGYPGGGNYWSDYSGVDHCGGPGQDDCSTPDGLGDTAYFVTSPRTDRYPLMIPASAEGDTIPPTVAIATPADGAVVATTPISASGAAADSGSGVRRVEVRVNGGVWSPASGTTTWGLLGVPLAAGPNTIEARALDHAGNMSAIASAAVTYDPPDWGTVLQTDRATYPPGQAVAITFMVTNHDSVPLTLHFPTTCQAFFAVADAGGTRVYDQRYHVGCFLVLTQRTWQPGETVTYTFTWTQVNDAGSQVPSPADYQVRGFMDSSEPVPEGLKTITIAP